MALFDPNLGIDAHRWRLSADRDAPWDPQRLELLTSALAIGIALVGTGFCWRYVNQRFPALLGCTLDEIPNARAWLRLAFPNPAERRRVVAAWRQALEAGVPGEPCDQVLELRAKNGRKVAALVTTLQLADGDLLFSVADLTQTLRAEEALHESAQRYRLLFERNLAGMYRSTLDGQLLECNEAFARMFGCGSAAEVTCLPATSFHGEAASRDAFVREIKDRGSVLNFEGKGARLDGTPIWFVTNACLVPDAEGKRSVIEGSVFDLTQRCQMEEALAQSRRDYWELFEASLDAVLVSSPDDETIVDANRAACKLYGFEHQELVSRSWQSLGDVGATRDSLVGRTMSEGGLTDRRAVHRHRDGRPLALEISTTTVEYGGRTAVLSLHRDVTERLRNEAERERLIRLLHASATIANALHANPDPTQAAMQGLEILGTVANATRCAWLEVTHRDRDVVHFSVAAEWCAPGIASVTPRFPERWLPSMLFPGAAELLRRGETVLLRVCDLQGEGRAVLDLLGCQSVLLVPLIVGPEPVGYLCLDSTDPGREWYHEEYDLLEAVGESFAIALDRWREKARGERLSVLVEQATEGVVLVDERQCISYVNSAFCQLTGLLPVEVIGQPSALVMLALGGASGRNGPDWAGALGGEWRGRLNICAASGKFLWVEVTSFPLRDTTGAVAGHACLLADITEQSRLEERLIQSQKMEALGKLAAGIAHDFNNVNMVVLGTVERLQRRLPACDATHEELTTIGRASKRAAELTRGLLAFARKQVLRKQRVELVGVVGEMLPMLRRLVPESIRIEFVPSPDPLVVDADVGQIEQVVVNLCVNARDAMPSGGVLSLHTKRRVLDVDYLSVRRWASEGAYAVLVVRDTGCGMSDETMRHILEPFFTTKSPGCGTGLGLASVYGIVKQHGGVLDFSSEVGVGSTFEVYLPLQTGAAGAAREPSGPQVMVGGSGRVLLVEDQSDLRLLESSVLAEFGYTVTSARDGAEALQLVERDPTGFDLVVTDLIMPGVGGLDLFRRLAEAGVRIPFLFVSGYPEEAAGEGIPDGPNIAYLSKPCSINDLAARIRELLQAAMWPAGPGGTP